MRTAFHALLLPLLLLALAAAPAAEEPKQPAHLTAALELVEQIKAGNNEYIFGGDEVVWTSPKSGDNTDDNQCVMKADCSGFINALFVHTMKLDAKQLKTWLGLTRPNAENYFKAIEAEHGFKKIGHIKDARGGDIMAMQYQRNYNGRATGHVMLVAGEAKKIEPVEPIIEGTTQWEIPVIDSAVTAHGPTDTRYQKGEEGKDATGVGLGLLRVYADENGTCVGYTWGIHRMRAKDFYPRSDRPLAIGRMSKTAIETKSE